MQRTWWFTLGFLELCYSQRQCHHCSSNIQSPQIKFSCSSWCKHVVGCWSAQCNVGVAKGVVVPCISCARAFEWFCDVCSNLHVPVRKHGSPTTWIFGVKLYNSTTCVLPGSPMWPIHGQPPLQFMVLPVLKLRGDPITFPASDSANRWTQYA